MSRSRDRAPSRPTSTFASRVAVSVGVACGTLVPTSAYALSSALAGPLAKTAWSQGDVPTYIDMFEYVPANVAPSPPVLVAAHYCTGSASAMFGFQQMPQIEAAADQFGFVLIFPQTTHVAGSTMSCWDMGSKASLTRNGGGDTQAIVEMVDYEIKTRHANADRVYMMGASSGAMLTEAVLALYPDVFKAGAEFSGVPAGCWGIGYDPSSNWSSVCDTAMSSGSAVLPTTAQAWGDLARGLDPGYTGYRPRLQLWHDVNDTTVVYANQTEAIEQWTNVLGLSAMPTSPPDTSTPEFTIRRWQDSCGFTVLEDHTGSAAIMPQHTAPIDATSVVDFFALNSTSAVDPEGAACDGGASGSSGSGGSGSGGSGDAGSGSSEGGSSADGGGSVPGSGSSSGAAGSGSGSSGSGDDAGGGNSGGAGSPGGGGCAVSPVHAPSPTGAILAAGLLGSAVVGRRRRRRR